MAKNHNQVRPKKQENTEKEPKENQNKKKQENTSFENILKELEHKKISTMPEKEVAEIEKNLVIIKTLIQKTDKVERELEKDPKNILTINEDPFELLYKIEDTDLSIKITKALLAKPWLQTYWALQLSKDTSGERVKGLKKLRNNLTPDNPLATTIDKLLIGIKDLSKADGAYRLKKIAELENHANTIREFMKDKINLENVLGTPENFKTALAEEIKNNFVGKRYTIITSDDDNDDDPEDVEEEHTTYPRISKFYREHLTPEKINQQTIITKLEYSGLTEDILRAFNDLDKEKFPNLKILLEKLNSPEIVKLINTNQEVETKPKKTTSGDFINKPAEPKVEEKDRSGLGWGILAATQIYSFDLLFKSILFSIFSPISFSIWASKEMLKIGKKGDAKLDIKYKDFADSVWPVSMLEDTPPNKK